MSRLNSINLSNDELSLRETETGIEKERERGEREREREREDIGRVNYQGR